MTDYLKKYGVKNYRKFQGGGAAAPPVEAAPAEGGAPAGADPAVQQAAELVMQLVDAAVQGDPQAGEIVMQIAEAVAGGGAEGGAPPAEGGPVARDGSMVYRQGGVIGGPTFRKRSALIPHQR